jgi:hypothetical protein
VALYRLRAVFFLPADSLPPRFRYTRSTRHGVVGEILASGFD